MWDNDAFRGRRALITGGLGFLGSALARRLVSLGAAVRIVDSLDPRYGGHRANVEDMACQLDVRVADVRRCLDHPEWVIEQDYVFNLAGQVSHLGSMEDPQSDYRANCETHLAVLEACARHNRAASIVYAGTRGQYGRARYLPVDERHPLQPIDVNGLHKVVGEAYHWCYARQRGLRVTSLRFTNIYGPGHTMKTSRQGFLNWFVRLTLDHEAIPVYGDGRQRRDFVYVDDAVEALLAAAVAPSANGEAFNVGSGEPVSVVDVAQLLTTIAGEGTHYLQPYPTDAQRIEVGDYWTDIRKIREMLGWTPRIALDEGLRRTLDFYRRARDRYGTETAAAVTP